MNSQRRQHVLAMVSAAVAAIGVLAGCGSSDNPISAPVDRPIGAAPSAAASSAPPDLSSGSSSGDALASASPGASAAPAGVVVSGQGFSVVLPGQPEKKSQSAKGSITFDIYRYEGPDATYTVTRGSYPKIGTLPTLTEALKSAAGQAGGKLATSRLLKYRHRPAIEGVITGVTFEGHDVSIFARYVVVDRVMYGLLYLDRAGGSEFTPAFTTFVESLTV